MTYLFPSPTFPIRAPRQKDPRDSVLHAKGGAILTKRKPDQLRHRTTVSCDLPRLHPRSGKGAKRGRRVKEEKNVKKRVEEIYWHFKKPMWQFPRAKKESTIWLLTDLCA
ncbi:hypothetical protein BDQ94DRAFT_142719 [Aspergillus welwitschiae]|uniref:Uncharacterized protein n=1 Tax=Aspergillus welwitschiae TaxID=1341132 RepID=A0A3F3Q3M6_9EURO|nr:hypothetical protein BDQ94DRAFT_142719 [Aspergillus welwitschiae]RDH33814.1 hypothetical protein BDQ94DRAFT_142719 [Aspergillus welwitschiae]